MNPHSLSTALTATSALGPESPVSGKAIARLAKAIEAEPMSIGDVRLLKLADFLDTLEPEKFNINSFVATMDRGCGSVCCALGWCPKVFPDDWVWVDGLDGARLKHSRKFGPFIDSQEFFHFAPDGYGWRHLFAAQSYHPNVHPVTVADRIREFVAARNPKGGVAHAK